MFTGSVTKGLDIVDSRAIFFISELSGCETASAVAG